MADWLNFLLLATSQATQAFLEFCTAMDKFDTFMILALILCVLAIHHDHLDKLATFLASHILRLCCLLLDAANHTLSVIHHFAIQLSAIIKQNVVLPATHWLTAIANSIHFHLIHLYCFIILPTLDLAVQLCKSARNQIFNILTSVCNILLDFVDSGCNHIVAFIHGICDLLVRTRDDVKKLPRATCTTFIAIITALVTAYLCMTFCIYISFYFLLSLDQVCWFLLHYLIFVACLTGFVVFVSALDLCNIPTTPFASQHSLEYFVDYVDLDLDLDFDLNVLINAADAMETSTRTLVSGLSASTTSTSSTSSTITDIETETETETETEPEFPDAVTLYMMHLQHQTP